MSSKLYSISSEEELPVVCLQCFSIFCTFLLGHLFVVFLIVNIVPNIQVSVRSLKFFYTRSTSFELLEYINIFLEIWCPNLNHTLAR